VTVRSSARRETALGLLAACGAYQVVLGFYFILWRPSLLPEDLRFIGGSAATVRAAAPGMESWLQWVFLVMGGQMIGVGVLTLLAAARESKGHPGSPADILFLAAAAASTALLMSAANFAIGSDFRWVLLAPVALWIVTLFLHAGGSTR